jgi:hypothetical protein
MTVSDQWTEILRCRNCAATGVATLARRAGFYVQLAGSEPLEAHHIQLIGDGKAAIHVFGLIKYNDVFGSSRETRFYLEYTRACFDDGTNKLQSCSEGNRST